MKNKYIKKIVSCVVVLGLHMSYAQDQSLEKYSFSKTFNNDPYSPLQCIYKAEGSIEIDKENETITYQGKVMRNAKESVFLAEVTVGDAYTTTSEDGLFALTLINTSDLEAIELSYDEMTDPYFGGSWSSSNGGADPRHPREFDRIDPDWPTTAVTIKRGEFEIIKNELFSFCSITSGDAMQDETVVVTCTSEENPNLKDHTLYYKTKKSDAVKVLSNTDYNRRDKIYSASFTVQTNVSFGKLYPQEVELNIKRIPNNTDVEKHIYCNDEETFIAVDEFEQIKND